MAWNGSGGEMTAKAPPKKGGVSLSHGLIALLLVMVIGVGAYFLLTTQTRKPSRPTADREDEKPAAIEEVAPEIVFPEIEREAVVRASTADKGSLPERTEISDARQDQSKNDAAKETIPPKPAKKIFKHGTDQLIWLAVFASNGTTIPPLPHISDEDTERFVESLRKEIDFESDDPEHIREMKMAVNDVRKQIADMIAQNPDTGLAEILRMHRDKFNTNLDLRAKAREGYDAIVEEGDQEGAQAYLEKANELLSLYGADPIEIEEDEEEAINE